MTGQPAVVGVPVRAGADDPSGSATQRPNGRHTKVRIAPTPGTEPHRTADRAKSSRRSWFGLGQTEKEVVALQERLEGMSETERRQADGAVRYLQERWRSRVKMHVAAHAATHRFTTLLGATVSARERRALAA